MQTKFLTGIMIGNALVTVALVAFIATGDGAGDAPNTTGDDATARQIDSRPSPERDAGTESTARRTPSDSPPSATTTARLNEVTERLNHLEATFDELRIIRVIE